MYLDRGEPGSCWTGPDYTLGTVPQVQFRSLSSDYEEDLANLRCILNAAVALLGTYLNPAVYKCLGSATAWPPREFFPALIACYNHHTPKGDLLDTDVILGVERSRSGEEVGIGAGQITNSNRE